MFVTTQSFGNVDSGPGGALPLEERFGLIVKKEQLDELGKGMEIHQQRSLAGATSSSSTTVEELEEWSADQITTIFFSLPPSLHFCYL